MATLSGAKRLVVKIGSALLVDQSTGKLRQDWLKTLAADVAALKAAGKDVVLVSSGSIALGRGVLGLPLSSLPLAQSQAAAAVGQIQLARAYEEKTKKVNNLYSAFRKARAPTYIWSEISFILPSPASCFNIEILLIHM